MAFRPCFYGFLRIWPNMAKHENFGSKKNFFGQFFFMFKMTQKTIFHRFLVLKRPKTVILDHFRTVFGLIFHVSKVLKGDKSRISSSRCPFPVSAPSVLILHEQWRRNLRELENQARPTIPSLSSRFHRSHPIMRLVALEYNHSTLKILPS